MATRRRKPLNLLGLAILVLLRERPMHPYEMSKTMKERHKEESIKLNYGSLYTMIATLEKEGLIAELEKDREGARPEKTVYYLTTNGFNEMHDWMSRLIRKPDKEYPRFESALSLLGVLHPDTVLNLLEERVVNLRKEIQRKQDSMEEAHRAGIHRLFSIEDEYSIHMLEAEKEWVSRLIYLIKESEDFYGEWREIHKSLPFEHRS